MAPPRKPRAGRPLPPNCYQKSRCFYWVHKTSDGRRRWLNLGREEEPARQEAETLNQLRRDERLGV